MFRRERRGEVLFIDARKMGVLVDRTHRELTADEITHIARTYHMWKLDTAALHEWAKKEGILLDFGPVYTDTPGFCKSATLAEVRKHGHVLTPGRYVGAEAAEDDGEPFEEKMQRLVKELEDQFEESHRLEAAIRENLRGMGFGC